MNIKKAMNSQLNKYQQLNLKKPQQQLSKRPEQEQNQRYGDHLEGYQLQGGRREWREMCRD